MLRIRITGFVVFLLIVSQGGFSQVTAESSMDWTTGLFRITAYRPLDEGMSPSDHPRALGEMEQEIIPLAAQELSQLAWDSRGSLADLVKSETVPLMMEDLAGSLDRDWSRISPDRKAVEAAYTLNLAKILTKPIPPDTSMEPATIPVGWIPIPDDGWTGIFIYVPNGIDVRGTGFTANPQPALRAKILSDDLRILADPGVTSDRPLSYMLIDNRNNGEPLVGRRPYLVMARELYGEYPCDIILSEDDSKRIMAAPSGREALSEGRIVILLDSLPD